MYQPSPSTEEMEIVPDINSQTNLTQLKLKSPFVFHIVSNCQLLAKDLLEEEEGGVGVNVDETSRLQQSQQQQQQHRFFQQQRPSGPTGTVIIIQQSSKAKEQQSNESRKEANKGKTKTPKRQTEKKEMQQPDLEESRKSSPVVNKAKNQYEASKQTEVLAGTQATVTKHQATKAGLTILVQQTQARRSTKQAEKIGISLTRPIVHLEFIWTTSQSILMLKLRLVPHKDVSLALVMMMLRAIHRQRDREHAPPHLCNGSLLPRTLL